MNASELRQQIRTAVDCSCCTLNEEAVSRVAAYIESLASTAQGTVDVSSEWVARSDDLLNDLYLFTIFDRDLELSPATDADTRGV